MKCLRKNGADAREANQYATGEDFDRIFAEDMDRLHQLSFLLTRDQAHTLADAAAAASVPAFAAVWNNPEDDAYDGL